MKDKLLIDSCIYKFTVAHHTQLHGRNTKSKNTAGRLPEHSRDSFVDLLSQKDIKNRPKKKFLFIKF